MERTVASAPVVDAFFSKEVPIIELFLLSVLPEDKTQV